MACCSHIDKNAPKGFCANCMFPLRPRQIIAEPVGKTVVSIECRFLESTGLSHTELVSASRHVVDDKFFFVVFPNGMKLHPSVL
jgi:hypothetical protein